MDTTLPAAALRRLTRLGHALIDQHAARVLVEPIERAPGFWFGGGDMARLADGGFVLCGRHRVFGDSRTGTDLGDRGAQLALYRSRSFDGPFERWLTWSKQTVAPAGERVISIEGASLLARPGPVELFVSSEKERPYPAPWTQYQKPGTGVWSVDVIAAPTLDLLPTAPARPVLSTDEAACLHLKDPKAHAAADGATMLLCCTHPYSWSSANTALYRREARGGDFNLVSSQVLGRGPVWDVASTRLSARLPLPRVGLLADLPPLSLYFYDGAECVRQLPENPEAVRRPRGYSCEELGGLAWGFDDEFPYLQRISVDEPFFVSPHIGAPHGTGCSRYVSTLATPDAIFATWQQGQLDGSQPLVGHALSMERVKELLGGDG